MDVMYCKRRSRSILNLHDDILVTIFSRLSITTILQCKRVCKSLYNFLSSRYFAESYQSNPPFTSLIIHNGEFFSLLELNSGYNYSLKSSKPKILPDPFGLSYCGQGTRFMVGSCNGFFCYSDKDVLYVSNPLSGTHVRLPEEVLDVFQRSYGFGFCPQTQQYKVIELASYVRRPSSRTEVHVFTVGVDKFWRRIHSPFQHIQQRVDKSYPIIQFLEVNGKGALHWIVDDSNRLDYLYSFDINEEKVRPIPPPVGLKKRNMSTLLLFMHGCVCLLHMNENEKSVVYFWCMKDYMVQGSWTVRIISGTFFPEFFSVRGFNSVGVWKNEEILMICQSNYIVSCNLEQKNFNKLHINLRGSYIDHVAACFVPNFFSSLETGTTTKEETKDVAAARKLGFLSQKNLEPTELGNGRARIMENILSKVPVDKIRFAKTYSMLSNTVHLILCDKASPRFLYELKSDLNNNVKASQLLAATPSIAKVTVLGSCNGLVCLSVLNDHPGDQTHSICICNPVVQELAILPQPEGVKRIRDEAYGFGFSSISGHYKVLRILTRKWCPGKFEAYVLTIGIDNNWRQLVGGGNFRMPKKWPRNINKARFCDVPFNNAIHWIGEGDSKIIIYAFDIDEEQFTSLAHLPGIYNTKYNYCYPCLGTLRDFLCLCVIHLQIPYAVELWSMRTYGSVASWTREEISIPICIRKSYRRVGLPVTSWRDEEILMWVEDGGGTLISYCLRDKRYTKIKIDVAANNEALITISYVQSSLSLRDAFQNGNLEVKEMELPFKIDCAKGNVNKS